MFPIWEHFVSQEVLQWITFTTVSLPMKLYNKKLIDEFSNNHADIRAPLAAWVYEAEDADWKTPLEIKERYPSATMINGERFVFNIKGDKYRLDVTLYFERKIVWVKRIGTHAEYDKWTF